MEARRWLMGHFRLEGDKVQIGTEARWGEQRRDGFSPKRSLPLVWWGRTGTKQINRQTYKIKVERHKAGCGDEERLSR